MFAGAGSAGWRCRSAVIRARALTSNCSGPILDTSRSTRLSRKAESFTESVIREMTRLNLALNGPEKAVNFAQGFPDFPASAEIIEAAKLALDEGYNQYATTWGAPQRRTATAAQQSRWWGRAIDPEREITVACGATEAMIAAM